MPIIRRPRGPAPEFPIVVHFCLKHPDIRTAATSKPATPTKGKPMQQMMEVAPMPMPAPYAPAAAAPRVLARLLRWGAALAAAAGCIGAAAQGAAHPPNLPPARPVL